MDREILVLTSLVGIHLLWVLAPLLPAILIFWLFPSTSVASKRPIGKSDRSCWRGFCRLSYRLCHDLHRH